MSSPLKVYEIATVGGGNGGPNPAKVFILLNKLGLDYETITKEFNDDEKNGVKGADFLKVNPNGRVPALVDGDLTVFESGAILAYLAEKYDETGTYLGKDVKEKALINSWVFHQASGLGPVQGQTVYMTKHFQRIYGEAPSDAVKKRFTDERERLYKVLEGQLERQKAQGSEWVVLNRMTNADISFFGWVSLATLNGIDLSPFPQIQAWLKRMEADPGVVAFRKRHPFK